jgi:hypothetical protein
MKLFFGYLKDFFREINPVNFLSTTLFVAVLVFINYFFGIEKNIRHINSWPLQYFTFYIFFTTVFAVSYVVSLRDATIDQIENKKLFLFLILFVPAIFSLKIIRWDVITESTGNLAYPWNHYWAQVLQLPVKLVMTLLFLFLTWKTILKDKSFFGFITRSSNLKPYALILICLIPLVAIASTQHDFLHTYPKVKSIAFINGYTSPLWPWQILYEISYGLDFVSIELFFRGFLVIGLARFVGIHAILPMAAFYCTIHFGKPLGECISSYFGGLALGVIAFRTRSIFGGLILHLGLAWLMEIGGYAGLLYFSSH